MTLIEALARYAEEELEGVVGHRIEVHLFKDTDGKLKSFSCLCKKTMITLFSAYKMTDSSLSYSHLDVADDGMALINTWNEYTVLSAEDLKKFREGH